MDTTIIISIGALIVAALGLLLNTRKETRNDAAVLAKIEAGLNTANAGINDLRVEIRGLRDVIRDHSERLAKVEAELELLKHKVKE